ncbi:hypothetical protein CSKR_105355 [Clonorchis sinensis]|uniref:Uncharacterized protein n=1 Tax=Clonorchis sinensis TaxID=79923 RepID=A0A3R7FMM1_CLOSI|nr:hypothetical protein CSKR_105355 [Clonorchis sinensis]
MTINNTPGYHSIVSPFTGYTHKTIAPPPQSGRNFVVQIEKPCYPEVSAGVLHRFNGSRVTLNVIQ